MKHFFLINPVCAKMKGKVEDYVKEIHRVMKEFPELKYDIHISRWKRDAQCFCHRYVKEAEKEIVRVHVLGGNGTHFEVVNAIVNLPNVQIALYPMGRNNIFLRYFGKNDMKTFGSIRKQVISDVIHVDAFRCNQIYGISNMMIGFEAYIDERSEYWSKKTHINKDICHIIVALKNIFSYSFIHSCNISMDGLMFSNKYATVLAVNQPWYGRNMKLGFRAHPNSGMLNFYFVKNFQKLKKLMLISLYLFGKYERVLDVIHHCTGKKIVIQSEQYLRISVDGEVFYNNRVECEVLSGAIELVCSSEIEQ